MATKTITLGMREFFLYPDENTIGVGTVLRVLWIISALFAAGVLAVKGEFIWPFVYFASGCIWSPLNEFNKKDGSGFKLSRGVKFLITFFLLMWASYSFGKPPL